MDISPAIGRVGAGVGGRMTNCVWGPRVAATALLPVLRIGGVIHRVSVLVNGTRWNRGKGWWCRSALMVANFTW